MFKKIGVALLCLVLMCSFAVFALGSSEEEGSEDQGSSVAQKDDTGSNLGDYSIDIVSCRLAKDYQDKNIVIVKYKYTNNSDDPTSFMVAFDCTVYQDGVGLNECYVAADSAKYSTDNQTKEIKTGASIEVEEAYELNDSTTDIEVEVEELISFSDKKITKKFSIK